jgi:hypothetical protein
MDRQSRLPQPRLLCIQHPGHLYRTITARLIVSDQSFDMKARVPSSKDGCQFSVAKVHKPSSSSPSLNRCENGAALLKFE